MIDILSTLFDPKSYSKKDQIVVNRDHSELMAYRRVLRACNHPMHQQYIKAIQGRVNHLAKCYCIEEFLK